jgi:hypothetical protein
MNVCSPTSAKRRQEKVGARRVCTERSPLVGGQLGCVASPARKFMGEERRQKRREEGVRETNLASDSYAGWSDFSFSLLFISCLYQVNNI